MSAAAWRSAAGARWKGRGWGERGAGTGLEGDDGGCGIPVAPGEPRRRAARGAGMRWPNVCGGRAQCGVCAVEVTEAEGDLTAPTAREQQMLDRLPVRPRHGGTMRLACQLTACAPVRVTKLGVRKPA